VERCWFFYAGTVSEQLVLDCYRLAKYYGRDPDDFLAKPLSRIQSHMKYTSMLMEQQRSSEDEE